ncbi:DUF6537 domain-containing protein [Noviherbaspirillum sp.]|uniref:DUF6537 domain-containing protein n=1 Tax=Noviherbaspirillum sp. TaxID=1926288 RepID=UPI0039C97E09
MNKDNLALAAEIAALPEKIRGFGHVKEKAVAQYREERKLLLEKFQASLRGIPHAA